MTNFKDLGITAEAKGMEGDKIRIDRVLNREIIVYHYTIEASKFKQNEKCLYMQISVGETKHVVFSGSNVLMNMIQRVQPDKFPFKTTIVKNDQRLEFT